MITMHRQLHSGDPIIPGDCLRTAWASYLGFRHLTHVPHFALESSLRVDDDETTSGFHDMRGLREWTRRRGDFDAVALSLDEAEDFGGQAFADPRRSAETRVPAVAYVHSARTGVAHAIVWDLINDLCMLDPATGQPSDEYTRLDLKEIDNLIVLVHQYDPDPQTQFEMNTAGDTVIEFVVRPYLDPAREMHHPGM